MTTAQPIAVAPPTPHQLRDRLTDMVIKDLLGPAGGPEEELDWREDRVRERYLVGVLAPRNIAVEAGNLDQLDSGQADDVEVGATDATAPSNDTLFPSTMGLSFMVDADADRLLIDSEWGRYHRIHSDTQVNRNGQPALAWKREPVIGQPLVLSLREGSFEPFSPHARNRMSSFRGACAAPPTAGWSPSSWSTSSRKRRCSRTRSGSFSPPCG